MDAEKEGLLARSISDEVAGVSDDNQVLPIGYTVDNEELDGGALTETEDDPEEKGVARVEIILSKRTQRRGEQSVYTVEDAIDHMGFGPFQILVTVFAGMSWFAASFEVMLLSVLSPLVSCHWSLQDWEQAMLSSVVFIGFLIGGFCFGILADIIGRKTVLVVTMSIMLLFGLLSALAPTYSTLLLFRTMVGLGLGGNVQGVTIYAEFLPKKFRGACLVFLEMWWAIGTVLTVLLALLIVPNVPDPIESSVPYYEHINWRIYVGLCALPMAIVLIILLFVPESARFYISKGQVAKGEKVIVKIARINRKNPPTGRLVSQEDKELFEAKAEAAAAGSNSPELITDSTTESTFFDNNEDDQTPEAPLLSTSPTRYSSDDEKIEQYEEDQLSRATRLKRKGVALGTKVGKDLSILFTGGMWKTTILLMIIWFGCSWLYYGAVLLTTSIVGNGYNPHCGSNNQSINSEQCRNLTTSFYSQILWTSAAEFPGMFLTLIIIEIIGRKITMGVEFIGTAVFFGLILICVPEVWVTTFMFGARAFITGAFQAVYVYTPEVFPTKVRGAAMGLMMTSTRLGALITPFIAQALFPVSDYTTISLYAGSALLLTVLSFILPIETKRRSLRDTKGQK